MNDLLTVQEVAQMLRVNGVTVRRWILTGALPAICLPHRAKRVSFRVRREDVEKIVEGGWNHATEPLC